MNASSALRRVTDLAWRLCLPFLLVLPLFAAPRTDAATKAQPAPGGEPLRSVFAANPPQIDGQVGSSEWSNATRLSFSNGALYLQNDATALYLLLAVTDATKLDDADGFSLRLSVGSDQGAGPQDDALYSLTRDGRLLRSAPAGPGTWATAGNSASLVGAGLGVLPEARAAHRFWELAISLPELRSRPGDELRLSLGTQAGTFDLVEALPMLLVSQTIDLLILAHQDFLTALQPLKTHKDTTGIATYVQSWQSINTLYAGSGRDEPERLKRAIADYQANSRVQYVMLVGDSNTFPVRYTMTDRGDANAFNRAFYVADLYYADLYKSDRSFSDWDSSRNNYFGELHGETIPGTVNIDNVDLVPDVAVGRVPATTAAEVTTYVNKVINYEFGAYGASWANSALMLATTDWLANACNTTEAIRTGPLSTFNSTRLYSSGNPCASTSLPTAANVNAALNLGVGMVAYVGHGNSGGLFGVYGTGDMTGLSNANKLPVLFAAACDTALFATLPPYDPYTDINGTHHIGTSAGEHFSNVPPAPASIQSQDNPSCFAEEMLVRHTTGAVAYIGCETGAQAPGADLETCFFQAYQGAYLKVLGHIWNNMVYRYYQMHVPPSTISPTDWYALATFHQPWKFPLMGDPSLRIGGISRIQKSTWLGSYNMNHDSWLGTLTLAANPDDPIEQIPNIVGTYTAAGQQQQHDVRGHVRTWSYPTAASWGPDHQIRLYADFNDTLTESDDQQFDGYLMTRTQDAIAGVTWWHNTPFGFYALTSGGLTLGYEATRSSSSLSGGKSDFVGRYRMVHDGWRGMLTLLAANDDPIEQLPNIVGTYDGDDGFQCSVRGYVRTSTYPIDASWGPDHKIELRIDFFKTPNTSDDTVFEGYLFTHNREAIAGRYAGWGTTYGFYAVRQSPPAFLPMVRKG